MLLVWMSSAQYVDNGSSPMIETNIRFEVQPTGDSSFAVYRQEFIQFTKGTEVFRIPSSDCDYAGNIFADGDGFRSTYHTQFKENDGRLAGVWEDACDWCPTFYHALEAIKRCYEPKRDLTTAQPRKI